MAVTISLTEELHATVNAGIWASNEPMLRRILQRGYDPSVIENYTPWPDFTLAEMAVKALGGKIVETIDPPEFVDGRIY